MKRISSSKQVAMEVLFTGHGPTTFKGRRHDLSRAYLAGLFLENAEMPGVILDGADLQKAWLKGSNLRGARLVLADLHEADLSYADLRDCLLVNTNLTNAILCGADLRGANLLRANLAGACLDGIKLDDPEQLALAASLYKSFGLDDAAQSALNERNPELFWKPVTPEDDPDNIFR